MGVHPYVNSLCLQSLRIIAVTLAMTGWLIVDAIISKAAIEKKMLCIQSFLYILEIDHLTLSQHNSRRHQLYRNYYAWVHDPHNASHNTILDNELNK